MPASPDLALIDQYQPKFESIWRRLSQQSEGRLAKAVDVQTGCTGLVNYRDQIKPIDVLSLGSGATSGRIQPIPISEIQTQKRAVFPEKFWVYKHFDRMDATFLKQQSVPTSQTFTEMKSGFARKQDDLIIAAATGTAKTGNNGGTDTDLPATQQVDVQAGSGATPANTRMNLTKLLDAKQILEQNEVFGQEVEGEPMGYFACSSEELRDLYNDVKVTSADYAGELKALYYGEIDQFLGFKFIRTERLTVTANIRSCFAWVKSGICLDIWENPTLELDKRTDYNHPWQLVGYGSMQAARLEEEKVVEIPVDTSVAVA